MIRLIFVTSQRPLCERKWQMVPRTGEEFHHSKKSYTVQNVTYDDNGIGEAPTVYVFVIRSDRYRAWLTGEK